MLVGVPKEVKNHEYRVGLTPNSVYELVEHGHQVIVESQAGEALGFTDESYIEMGADVLGTAAEVYAKAEMIVKVKEPQASEFPMIRPNQILFTYLHLAPDPTQTKALLESGCIAIAYETVTSHQGGLPLLSPMSQVAGRLAVQAGARCLEKPQGGRGVLLGGVPGVAPANVVVIGGGVVGTNSVRMAMGLEANVTVLDKSLTRLQQLDFQFGCRLNTIYATKAALEQYVLDADLVIGAVLTAGASAPQLVSRQMLDEMRPGSVMVDVSIDQGGCFETSRPTTHNEPTYVEGGVVHYCVTNMPGAVPYTATKGLNNATLPFVLDIADKGYRRALIEDPHLMNGLNIHVGHVTHSAVAKDLGLEYVEAINILQS
ncbi:MAG: alanine dehydrogenase [Coxiellaceae bacterium]|nr:alanine dehydrogenase [Coxiellaceae bacterium]